MNWCAILHEIAPLVVSWSRLFRTHKREDIPDDRIRVRILGLFGGHAEDGAAVGGDLRRALVLGADPHVDPSVWDGVHDVVAVHQPGPGQLDRVVENEIKVDVLGVDLVPDLDGLGLVGITRLATHQDVGPQMVGPDDQIRLVALGRPEADRVAFPQGKASP